ncbi:hypothetical protein AJ80_04965 [Polytolypa hystricis UAMH7299]|uniref:ORC6 first cyclin-like domain-containing protein n=1 Tax=Polytolypa hystricis (strain UAMH7299) TaxID=1447883 RepID=A0A2B7Y886_POLH7|nr:hypothetical protein AJ80_04965 [Polytolypa hystricis UAMH7299]
MSNRPIEQALANLLPTHAEALPSELIQHATNLLAQSRSYGSSLKPEEEIARPHACAEIACKRLSKSLQLPPLLGRPPCPPRVYKKLYTYLEQALLKASGASRRDNTRNDAPTGTPQSTPKKPATTSTPLKTPSKTGTPLKRSAPATPSQKLGQRSAKKRRAKRTLLSSGIKDAPSWTMPLIRRVCTTLSTPTATSTDLSRPSISTTLPPHIFTGLSSVLSLVSSNYTADKPDEDSAFLSPIIDNDDPETQNPEYRERIMTLIVALYFVVLSRRRPMDASASSAPGELDVDTYVEMSAAALSSIGIMGQKSVNDVDVWLSIIMARDWTNGKEWFDNIPSPEDEWDEQQDRDGARDASEDDEAIISPQRRRQMSQRARQKSSGSNKVDVVGQLAPVKAGGLLPGLGTMMQDRVDWLSEERRADYLLWKRDVMKRIRAIERSGKAIG